MPHLMLALDLLGTVMVAVGFGGLIFIHELGHYLACRVTGTRVEAFSIGFGPKILGWRRGHTVYKLSLFPLGGYVKMAAENPGDKGTGAPDEFPQKSYSQRLLIMSAGVIFNGILAFLLFVWAFGLGTPFPSAELGSVASGGAAWQAGLQRGDVVRRVNGYPIVSFDDLAVEVALSGAGEDLELVVVRDGVERAVAVKPTYSELRGMPTIGIDAAIDPAAAQVAPDSAGARAGAREGDEVIAVGAIAVDGMEELGNELGRIAGRAPPGAKEAPLEFRVRRKDGTEDTLSFTVPIRRDHPQIGIVPFFGRRVTAVREDVTKFRKGDVVLAIDGRPVVDFQVFRVAATGHAMVRTVLVRRDEAELEIAFENTTDRALADMIHCGTWDGEGTRVSPRPGMPAERAGLMPGDTVVAVAGAAVANWESIRQAVEKNGDRSLPLRVKRGEEELDVTVEPAGRILLEDVGYAYARKQTIEKETRFGAALVLGWDRTVRSVRHVVYTLKSLVTARVSVKNVGGPIAIAEMTYGMFAYGFAKYLYFLALISINLAILNLLPIPVLDGGQIVILTAEKIRGEPLPERVVGYLQLVGLVLILSLLALAFTNDISRLLR